MVALASSLPRRYSWCLSTAAAIGKGYSMTSFGWWSGVLMKQCCSQCEKTKKNMIKWITIPLYPIRSHYIPEHLQFMEVFDIGLFGMMHNYTQKNAWSLGWCFKGPTGPIGFTTLVSRSPKWVVGALEHCLFVHNRWDNPSHWLIFFKIYHYYTGWWFGTFGLYFPYIGNVIIPTDELIFFRGVAQPPTRWCSSLISMYCIVSPC